MKKLKVFVSYTRSDYPVAKKVVKVFEKAFRGRIETFLDKEKIRAGDLWKDALISNLKKSDALIFILSKDSIQQVWPFIEWSHFWMNKKPIFTIILEEEVIGILKNRFENFPILDVQYLQLTDKSDLQKDRHAIEGFFEVINEHIEYEDFKYGTVDDFIKEIEQAFVQKEDKKFSIYEDKNKGLPASDFDKKEIAQYFLERRKIVPLTRLVSGIVDDSIKYDTARKILLQSKFEHSEELQFFHEVSKTIDRPVYLEYMAKDLIEIGDISTDVLQDILERLASRDQSGLRNIAEYLYRENLKDSELFFNTCSLITNDGTLAKLIRFFISKNEDNSPQFSLLINKCDSNFHLKNIAIELFAENKLDSKALLLVLSKINSIRNLTEITIFMIENNLYQSKAFSETLNRVTTSSELQKILKALHNNNLHRDPLFDSVYIKAADTTSTTAVKVVKEIMETDPAFAKEITAKFADKYPKLAKLK